MSAWKQLTARRWRKEVPLPIGWVIAEIAQRDDLDWYDEHIEIHFADGAPAPHPKRPVGAPALAQAQAQCDALIAELEWMEWL